MTILISGSTGLIGSALVRSLTTQRHQVKRLVRPGAPIAEGSVLWEPERGRLDARAIEGIDAVIHLAGENIAAGRWTTAQKKRIRQSRVRGSQLLCNRLKNLERPPKVAVLASAIGYYGDRGGEKLTEMSQPGQGFLAEVTREWEDATAVLDDSPIRVIRLRIGVVLSKEGGALARMLPAFRRGLGGRLGSGRQYMSWIALEDLIQAVEYCLVNDDLAGPVNAVSPHPVTNREFTNTLGKMLHRPTAFTAPAFVLKLMMGEMAETLLLSSARVLPRRLEESGYVFRYPDLESALRAVLA